LSEIQDFLKRKSEEDEELPFNYQWLWEEIKTSGSTRTLDEVQEDFEHMMKMKVQHFMEDQQREALALEDGLAEPMPPLVYGNSME
jgi:hypothetical protein